MGEQIVKVNGVEYTFIDANITSSEIGMASFSGYMAFSGSLSEGSFEKNSWKLWFSAIFKPLKP